MCSPPSTLALLLLPPLVLLLPASLAWPDGAPCVHSVMDSMNPLEAVEHQGGLQLSDPPFAIEVDSGCYQQGRPISLTLRANGSAEFKGFAMQPLVFEGLGRTGTRRTGQFVRMDDNGSWQFQCFKYRDSITHSHDEGKGVMRLWWRGDSTETVQFVATVVISLRKFWVKSVVSIPVPACSHQSQFGSWMRPMPTMPPPPSDNFKLDTFQMFNGGSASQLVQQLVQVPPEQQHRHFPRPIPSSSSDNNLAPVFFRTPEPAPAAFSPPPPRNQLRRPSVQRQFQRFGQTNLPNCHDLSSQGQCAQWLPFCTTSAWMHQFSDCPFLVIRNGDSERIMHHRQQQHFQSQSSPQHSFSSLQPFGGTNSAHSSPLKRVPAAVSPLASPMESRRLFVPTSSAEQPMLSPLQLGYSIGPQPAKLLVDPQTGQQYYLPSPQPMPYPYPTPLFYNQPPPALYPAVSQPHSNYMFANSAMMFAPQPHHPQQQPSNRQRAQSPPAAVGRYSACPSSAAYRVELPPSSVGSVCEDDRSQQQQQPRSCRTSTEERSEMQSNPDESPMAHSPPPPQFAQSVNSPLSLKFVHQQHSPFLEQPTSGGGSSSESTSGFASAGRDPRNEAGSPHPIPRSPMREQRMHFTTDDGNKAKSPPPQQQALPRMKAIRMNIDLKATRPMSPPEEGMSVLRATVLRTAPPTAFTISFNDDPSPPQKQKGGGNNNGEQHSVSISGIRELSLQEAARQAPTGRRLLARRSVPPKAGLEEQPMSRREHTPAADSGSEAGDPKRWLFKKMMMGREGKADADGETTNEEDGGEDLASEAGTYVVDRGDGTLSQSQITLTKAKGSASSSSASSTASSASRTPSPQALKTVSTIVPAGEKRSLMSDLRRLREQKNAPKPDLLPKVSQRKVPQQPQQLSARPCRPVKELPFRPHTTAGSSSRCRSEPRTDGGRFSMRPTRPAAVGGAKGQQPTRQSLGATAAGSKAQQQQPSPEMVAWLRRKEYDPRKAAASNTQLKQQLMRLAPLALPEESAGTSDEEAFIAARSFSTSATSKSPFARWRQRNNGAAAHSSAIMVGDQRSNRSHDDLSRLGESLDEESLLGGGGGNSSGASSLHRTVDELTQKCHKSIALLKLCNQSALSSSVENLLERVVDGERTEGQDQGDNISDRLERLSSAFDAISKYLEEQSTISGSRGSLAALTSTNTGKMAREWPMNSEGGKR